MKKIKDLIQAGALFVINDSAGKDSQVMKLKILAMVPHNQIIIVHAHLPEVEWDGNLEHIKKYAQGVPVFEVRAGKTFFQMVDHRKMFPSVNHRQCTSDLKRGPIQKLINNYAKTNGFNLVVNCMGMRAQESPDRAKKKVFKLDHKNRNRTQYSWLPIHKMKLPQIWKAIREAGQEPHWAYKEGMTRLSCCFCIMSSLADIKTAARLRPDLAKRYMAKERELNFSMNMSRVFLDEIISAQANPVPEKL